MLELLLNPFVIFIFCAANRVHYLFLNKESRKDPKHHLSCASARVSISFEVVANELTIFSHEHKGKRESGRGVILCKWRRQMRNHRSEVASVLSSKWNVILSLSSVSVSFPQTPLI